MGRFLFVVPPLHGHINPTISVARALEERGHQVAWVGYTEPARTLLPPGAELLQILDELPPDVQASIEAKSRGLRGAAALSFLWEDFLWPLARHMAPGVDRAVDEFRPDVLIADQQALAGAAVAQRRGLSWATSATTTAELTELFSRLPKVQEWIDSGLRALQRDLGVPDDVAEKCDLRFSDRLVIVFSTPELMGSGQRFPAEYAFVGPSIHARPETVDFPWEWLDETRPRVLISLGTVNAEVGGAFFAAVLEAFPEPDRQIVLVAPPDAVGPVPDHVLVRPRVPQLALLEKIDAVVCHGGHNTVCESLARGLPLVVCPIRDDQPVIAAQVASSGAGLRIRFGRIRAAALRSAVDQVLNEPAFRQTAARIGASFREAGGAPRAVERLEELLGPGSGSSCLEELL